MNDTHKELLKKRKEQKKKKERIYTPDEVFYIFEKTLDGWKTIKTFNTYIQNNPQSNLTKEWVEKIALGNAKLFPSDLPEEKYNQYVELRQKVYDYHIISKQLKNVKENN